MARRKAAKRPRAKKQPINLLAISESLLLANAVTTAAFNANIMDFITGTKDGKYVAGADGSFRITMPELLGVSGSGGFGGTYYKTSFTEVVAKNLKSNGISLATQLVTIPIAFRVGGKLLSKPRRMTNKMLKMSQLGVKV